MQSDKCGPPASNVKRLSTTASRKPVSKAKEDNQLFSELNYLKDGKPPFENIVVAHTTLSAATMRALLQAVRLLSPFPPVTRYISFNHVDLDDEACIPLLEYAMQCPSLQTLELLGNKLGKATCERIAQLLRHNQLQRLKLGDNHLQDDGVHQLAQGLRGNTSLRQLHLGNNAIGDLGLFCLAAALENNVTLTSLGLKDNIFGARGATCLALRLAHGCALSDLQLKGNNLSGGAALPLLNALYVNTSLRVLDFPGTKLGPEDAMALAQVLLTNQTINAVNLNDNHILEEGAEALARWLVCNGTVLTLGLRGNRIGPRGARAVARGLTANRALTGLDLSLNGIGGQGAVWLAAALHINTTLQSIDLHSNDIPCEGMLHLSTAVAANTSLQHLDMAGNHSGTHGAEGWATALQANQTLTRLSLTNNGIEELGGVALLHGLQENRSLRHLSLGSQVGVPPLGNQLSPPLRKLIRQRLAQNEETRTPSAHPIDGPACTSGEATAAARSSTGAAIPWSCGPPPEAAPGGPLVHYLPLSSKLNIHPHKALQAPHCGARQCRSDVPPGPGQPPALTTERDASSAFPFSVHLWQPSAPAAVQISVAPLAPTMSHLEASARVLAPVRQLPQPPQEFLAAPIHAPRKPSRASPSMRKAASVLSDGSPGHSTGSPRTPYSPSPGTPFQSATWKDELSQPSLFATAPGDIKPEDPSPNGSYDLAKLIQNLQDLGINDRADPFSLTLDPTAATHFSALSGILDRKAH